MQLPLIQIPAAALSAGGLPGARYREAADGGQQAQLTDGGPSLTLHAGLPESVFAATDRGMLPRAGRERRLVKDDGPRYNARAANW